MDHYSPYNLDWQPLLVHGWTNSRGGVNAMKRSNMKLKANDPYYRFLFDVLLMLLSRILNTAGAPLGRLVAAWIWMGRSVKALAKTLQRMLFSFIGWQARRAKSPWLRFISYYYPVKRWHVTCVLLVAASLTYKFLSFVWHCFNHVARRKRALIKDMGAAKTYKEWLEFARDMDELRVNDDDHQHSCLYAGDLLQEAMGEFQRFREDGNVQGLMHALRTELYRDFGNIMNRNVHKNRFVMPKPILDYILAVRGHLRYICDYEGDALSVDDKRRFFTEIRHAFGRTALVLSGGGSLGAFHLGVVRALMDQGVLPRIIAGSSVGSIVAAIVAVHNDDELKHMYDNMDSFNLSFFGNTTPLQTLQHLYAKGTLQDISFLIERLRALLGDCTFLECYQRTGRMLNVTVTAYDTREPPRMLNYLTAPDAVIWSAVAASSAFPALFPAQELLAKNKQGRFIKFASRSAGTKKRLWHDGSLENDLPFRQLSEVFNVNHFIVSQTNPHLVPFLSLKNMFSGTGAELIEAELKHAMVQAQLYAPRWLPTNWTRLFTQPWEGNVTVVLPWSLYCKGIFKAVTNPTSQDLLDADDGGRVATWKRMSAIQTNCGVEMELDICLSRFLQRNGSLTAGGAGGARQSRIPSWHCLPILSAFTPAVSLHAASRGNTSPTENGHPTASPADEDTDDSDDAPPPPVAPAPAAIEPAASEEQAPPPAQPTIDADEDAALAAATMDPNAPLPDLLANRRSKLSRACLSMKEIDIREFNADMLDALSILPMEGPSGSDGNTPGAPGSSSSRTRTPADWAGSDCTDNSVHVNLWENLIPIMKSGQVMVAQNCVDTYSIDYIAP